MNPSTKKARMLHLNRGGSIYGQPDYAAINKEVAASNAANPMATATPVQTASDYAAIDRQARLIGNAAATKAAAAQARTAIPGTATAAPARRTWGQATKELLGFNNGGVVKKTKGKGVRGMC